MRSTREELIKKGLIKERTEETIEEGNENQSSVKHNETSQDQSTTVVVTTDDQSQNIGKFVLSIH